MNYCRIIVHFDEVNTNDNCLKSHFASPAKKVKMLPGANWHNTVDMRLHNLAI